VIHGRSHITDWFRSTGRFVAAFLVAASVVLAVSGSVAQAQSVEGAGVERVTTSVDPQPASGNAGIELSIVGGDSLSVDPGAVVTVVYRIAAHSDSTIFLTPHFNIPDGWSIVFGSQDIEVLASQPTTRFVTYKVPENALAGTYEPLFSVASPENAYSASIASKVNVHSLHDLSIEAGTTPSFLAAGKSFEVPLTVANDGNARVEIILSAENRRFTNIELATDRLILDPGQHADVTAVVTTDADADRSQRIVLRFDARLADDTELSTYTSVAFDIVPVFARMRPKAANTPLSLSIETVGDESGASPQASIHASGKMLGGNVRVSAVLAESPRRRLYGQEPQVTVQYAKDNLSITAGDHSTYTSPMTLTGERGVGLAAQYQQESFRVKGSVQRSRTIIPVQERAALSATWVRSEDAEVSANLLHRNEYYDGTLLTFRSLSRPFGPTSKLDIECGISNGRVLQDPSCMLASTGSTRSVSYQLRAQRASMDFPGTLAGTRMLSAFTSYRMASSWRIEQMSSVMNRNVGSGANRHNLYAKIGLNYSARMNEGNLYATLHGIHSTARYTLLEGTTERIQNTLRLSAGYHLRRKGLAASIERGSASSNVQATGGSLTRFRLNGRYSVTAKIHVNASFEHSQGNLSSTVADQTNRQIGLGTTIAFRPDLQASVTAFHSVIESHFKQQYASMRAGVSKTFRSGRVLGFQAQFNHNEGRQTLRTADYRLSFTTPLAIPFSGSLKSGSVLNGRVIDQVTGAPMPDVLLFLGNDLAITDEKGRFRFVKPGEDVVFLRLDASTIGYDRTPVLPMPMEIGPERFNDQELIIPISQTATVLGRISVYRNGNTGENLIGDRQEDLTRSGGLGNAVVQIEGESLRQRTRTAGNGSFTFSQLPPGMYTVSVVRSHLDADQRLENDALKVLVEVGEAADLEFKVVPARKRIRMIKSSNLSLEPSPTENDTNSQEEQPPVVEQDPNSERDDIPDEDQADNAEAAAVSRPGNDATNPRGGWLSRLKETARAEVVSERDARDASVPPFYLERGAPPSGPTSPAYPLLFVLCILFLLVDADLLLRSILDGRQRNVLALKEASWMTTARFATIYAYFIVTVTAFAGPLAGLSVSLALSGVSVAIETRTTYRAMLNIVLLQLVARRSMGDWIRHRDSAVQLVDVSLDEIRVRHLNGLESSIPTHRLHVLSALAPTSASYEAVTIGIDFSRLSDLRFIRQALEETCSRVQPATLSSHVHIVFEDLDAAWTTARIQLVTERNHENLPVLEGMIEARLLESGIPLRSHASTGSTALKAIPAGGPQSSTREDSTQTGSHLRLVKGPDNRAA